MTIGVVSVGVIYLGLLSVCVHTGYVYLDFFYVASYVVYTGILHNNTLMWVFTDHTHISIWHQLWHVVQCDKWLVGAICIELCVRGYHIWDMQEASVGPGEGGLHASTLHIHSCAFSSVLQKKHWHNAQIPVLDKNYSLIMRGCYDRTLQVMGLVTETKVEKESSEGWYESYPNISLLNHKNNENWHTQKLPAIQTTLASFPGWGQA